MAAEREWSAEGVKAFVDDDDALINPKPYGNPVSTDHFTVIRHLVNFEVVNKHTNVPVNGFPASKPLVITVCFLASDAEAAGGANKLKLAMWDDKTKDWKNIPINRVSDCPFENFAGAYEARITSRWADPPISWGGGG
jgi:hypothetical protein